MVGNSNKPKVHIKCALEYVNYTNCPISVPTDIHVNCSRKSKVVEKYLWKESLKVSSSNRACGTCNK
jgi:hypothetical protein